MLIGGTFYAGEIKKSIFTLMNDRLPLEDVFPMHCSANVGDAGDVAIFFGLSGTGKTTLSADPERSLIGDDEHGWGEDGVFNFEGGCYAKVIRLSPRPSPRSTGRREPSGRSWRTSSMDEHGVVDLDDFSKTENTRAAYKLEQIANALPAKRAGHPSSAIFLTADAFGILPPIARLTRDQAMYWFLSGFTAKLAGTEIGVRSRSRPSRPASVRPSCRSRPWSTPVCWRRSSTSTAPSVWLVNTGWTGGQYGEGERMPIKATRALLRAALAASWTEPSTGRTRCSASRCRWTFPASTRSCSIRAAPGAIPRRTTRRPASWRGMFRENFAQFDADDNIVAGGPRL